MFGITDGLLDLVWMAKKNIVGYFKDELIAAQKYDDYINENYPDSHYRRNLLNKSLNTQINKTLYNSYF